ncbi:MAG: 50S ribosomal protein L6 [Candidatus Micrarchaeota archaeon]|nr:50S ribosomal protein L6 [Candidatus Micrarchaeota archaeon]
MTSVEVPSGVTIEIKDGTITVKGSAGANTRRFNDAMLKVSKEGANVNIEAVMGTPLARKAVKAEGALAKEIRNDIAGAQKPFEINMQTVSAHFPMALEVKGDTLIIKNVLGERAPRKAHIVGHTKVEAKGQAVRIHGPSHDDVSQTAANIRMACRVRRKDTRVFQDGIYYALEA